MKEGPAEYFSSRMTNKERKKTLVDELLVADDAFRYNFRYSRYNFYVCTKLCMYDVNMLCESTVLPQKKESKHVNESTCCLLFVQSGAGTDVICIFCLFCLFSLSVFFVSF